MKLVETRNPFSVGWKLRLTCQGKAHRPELRKELFDWVTAYKDAVERNALAECPDESADYLLALCEKWQQKTR